MLGGATISEIAFAGLLIALVLMAPLVPRVGGAVGRLFDKGDPKDGPGPA